MSRPTDKIFFKRPTKSKIRLLDSFFEKRKKREAPYSSTTLVNGLNISFKTKNSGIEKVLTYTTITRFGGTEKHHAVQRGCTFPRQETVFLRKKQTPKPVIKKE